MLLPYAVGLMGTVAWCIHVHSKFRPQSFTCTNAVCNHEPLIVLLCVFQFVLIHFLPVFPGPACRLGSRQWLVLRMRSSRRTCRRPSRWWRTPLTLWSRHPRDCRSMLRANHTRRCSSMELEVSTAGCSRLWSGVVLSCYLHSYTECIRALLIQIEEEARHA